MFGGTGNDSFNFTSGKEIKDFSTDETEWQVQGDVANGTYYLWAEITTVSGQTIRVYDDDAITIERDFRFAFLNTLSNENGDYYQLYKGISLPAEVEIGGQDVENISNVSFQLTNNSGEIVKPNIEFKETKFSTGSTSYNRYKLELDDVGLEPQQTYILHVDIHIQGMPCI